MQKSLKAMESLHRGFAQQQSGQLDEAVRLYKVVLRQFPDHFDALHWLGVAESQRGRHDRAEKSLLAAVKINPQSPEAFSNLGNVQRELGKFEQALASSERALQLRPGYANALNGRGLALLALDRLEQALVDFEQALALEPQFAGALNNRATTLRRLGRLEDALQSYDRTFAIAPTVPLLVDRGSLLVELGRTADGLALLDQALARDPRSADAHYNRGVALLQLEKLDEALASFDAAIAVQPAFGAALRNRGNVLLQLGRYDQAIASFDRALAADPAQLAALSDRGHAALAAFRFETAAESFARLVEHDPEYPYALGDLLFAKLYCCDWDGIAPLKARIAAGLQDGKRVVFPGHWIAASNSPADQLRAAEIWAADIYGSGTAPPPPALSKHGRIRIAYVSADFHAHATAFLMAELFERHDRTRFETIAVSHGPDDGSAMRTRLVGAFDHFLDVQHKSDDEVADLLRAMQVDIAVDLKGYTQGARLGIFQRRPAPIQVSYLGYPGTTGLGCIDYVLADRTVIPPDQQAFYTEHVVWLPDTYQVNDSTRAAGVESPSRAAAGLPPDGVVFCCFNSNYKITPEIFAIWMRLLAQVPGSVLWLLRPNETAVRHLRQAAQAAGVEPERIVFAERTDLASHLARLRLADLFLDTLPYNAHTTASDALLVGVPVLTCIGCAFPGRVAASLLQAAGLPELITDSLEAYEARALELARDAAARAGMRAQLAAHLESGPVFDTDRFRQHLERAFTEMVERHRRGEPPAPFAVEPLPPA